MWEFIINISIIICMVVIMAICFYYLLKEATICKETITKLKEKTEENDKHFQAVLDMITSTLEQLKKDLESDEDNKKKVRKVKPSRISLRLIMKNTKTI